MIIMTREGKEKFLYKLEGMAFNQARQNIVMLESGQNPSDKQQYLEDNFTTDYKYSFE